MMMMMMSWFHVPFVPEKCALLSTGSTLVQVGFVLFCCCSCSVLYILYCAVVIVLRFVSGFRGFDSLVIIHHVVVYKNMASSFFFAIII